MDKYESYDITDEQWKVIEPLMPPEYTGKKGRPRPDYGKRHTVDKSLGSSVETTS